MIGELTPEAVPVPRSDATIQVWRCDLDLPAEVVAQLETSLSAGERNRAARYKFARDRRRYITRSGFLRRILATYVAAAPADLILGRDENGKPHLSPPSPNPTVYFNVSNSHGLALVAVSRDREVGVDVERVRPIAELEAIAKRYLPASDLPGLLAATGPRRDELFFRGWTRMEATLKAIGIGLGSEKESDGTRCSVCDLSPAAGYVGAVAAQGADWTVDWSRPERLLGPSIDR